MVQSILFVVVFYLNTAVFLLLGSPLLLAPRKWAMVGLRLHARASLWWFKLIVGADFEVRGLENLPAEPCLIASKHHSAWETFALIPLFRDPAMVMKAELGHIPFYGWFSRKFEHILIERERGPSALRAMLAVARTRRDEGRDIVIFPEGTRRTVDAEPDYKPGVAALYAALDVPCVPVALNSGLFWPRAGLIKRPGTIVVDILPPIAPGLDRKAFILALQDRIETATDDLVAEARQT